MSATNTAGKPVTEEWCRRMGFVRRRSDLSIAAANGTEYILGEQARFLIVLEFTDKPYLSVEDRHSGESVLLISNPTETDVEVLDEISRRLHREIKQARTNPETGHTVGTNSGHGHVWKRTDGYKARCGGSGFCTQCQSDKAWADTLRQQGTTG